MPKKKTTLIGVDCPIRAAIHQARLAPIPGENAIYQKQRDGTTGLTRVNADPWQAYAIAPRRCRALDPPG
jgi:hypothetical protein